MAAASGLVGNWTVEDAAILLSFAHKIKTATIEAQGLRATGGYPEWPRAAYRPSQAWASRLNL
jgi:hypothetical protein